MVSVSWLILHDLGDVVLEIDSFVDGLAAHLSNGRAKVVWGENEALERCQ